jgi:chromosome segregation ATPase
LVFNNLPNSGKGRNVASSGSEGRLFNIDFDEVSIERIVHRDGVNEYYLNMPKRSRMISLHVQRT